MSSIVVILFFLNTFLLKKKLNKLGHLLNNNVEKTEEEYLIVQSSSWVKGVEQTIEYAKNNGYLTYIGNLSYFSNKTGDILTLLGVDKVSIQRKNAVSDAEFEEITEKSA